MGLFSFFSYNIFVKERRGAYGELYTRENCETWKSQALENSKIRWGEYIGARIRWAGIQRKRGVSKKNK